MARDKGTGWKPSKPFAPEVRERAVWLVHEQQDAHPDAVGGDPLHRREDRLYRGDAAVVGAPCRARYREAVGDHHRRA